MNFLRKSKIGLRLYGMFGFVVFCLLFIAYNGITSRLELINDSENLSRVVNEELRAFTSEFYDNTLAANHERLLDQAQEVLTYNISEMRAANRDIIIYVAVGFIFAIFMTVVIVRSVINPINQLINMLSGVTKGNLNINTNNNLIADDEVGILASDIYKFINIIKNVTDDLTNLTHEINDNGDLDYRIDTSKYSGSYKDMADGINIMVDSIVGDVMNLLHGLTEICNGNNIKMDNLPGKKAIMNERLNQLEDILNDFASDISRTASNAAKGDLDVKIETGKYKGHWSELVESLNDLILAVSEPMTEIEHTLKEMSQGRFVKMTGNYEGAFLSAKQSLNLTAETTLSYVEEIAQTLEAMAKGDLTVKIHQDYIGSYAPIKQALTTILDSLNKTLTEISSSANQVLSESGQISISSMQLAEGSTKQASTIQELTATINVINEKMRFNSEKASNANEFSKKSTNYAQDGNKAMKSMMSSMDSIKQSSINISNIIKTIEDIAFQTNLLALNAAVEAARAGEHGKGFAVVAEEVRNLAGRSQQSARDTTAMIEDSNNKVDDGMSSADSVANALETIINGVQQVSELISQIAEMTNEQSESISHINIGINEIGQVVQDNSATSEECAATSQELNAQAEKLQRLVSQFKLN
ncbi:MAG: methyl-accepting chemotaxis protein [Defluviitaleaceae bacterium]|nr:methyl-accepting chemotaxis protein [Defluviitaleaceae bacterium]